MQNIITYLFLFLSLIIFWNYVSAAGKGNLISFFNSIAKYLNEFLAEYLVIGKVVFCLKLHCKPEIVECTTFFPERLR